MFKQHMAKPLVEITGSAKALGHECQTALIVQMSKTPHIGDVCFRNLTYAIMIAFIAALYIQRGS